MSYLVDFGEVDAVVVERVELFGLAVILLSGQENGPVEQGHEQDDQMIL
jgi:hypothetical protein